MRLSDKAREALKHVSTATLTTVLFKRGLRNAYIQGVAPLNPDSPTMVGEAFTLRYIPSREDLDVIDVFKDPTIRSAPRSKPSRPGMCWSWIAAATPRSPRPEAS